MRCDKISMGDMYEENKCIKNFRSVKNQLSG